MGNGGVIWWIEIGNRRKRTSWKITGSLMGMGRRTFLKTAGFNKKKKLKNEYPPNQRKKNARLQIKKGKLKI